MLERVLAADIISVSEACLAKKFPPDAYMHLAFKELRKVFCTLVKE